MNRLLESPSTFSTDNQSGTDSTMMESLSKRRNKKSIDQQYISCDFVLGSAAYVELLWSTTRHILAEKKRLNVSAYLWISPVHED